MGFTSRSSSAEGKKGGKCFRSSPVRMTCKNSSKVYPAGSPVTGVRRKVATSRANTRHSELPASNEVAGRVNLLRLAEVGIPSWQESRRDAGMASRTVTLGVDEVTPQANQRPVLPTQIQRNGRNGEALLNPLAFGSDPDPVPALGIIPLILVTLALPRRAADRRQGENEHRGEHGASEHELARNRPHATPRVAGQRAPTLASSMSFVISWLGPTSRMLVQRRGRRLL